MTTVVDLLLIMRRQEENHAHRSNARVPPFANHTPRSTVRGAAQGRRLPGADPTPVFCAGQAAAAGRHQFNGLHSL